MRRVLWLFALSLGAAGPGGYANSIQEWRRQYEAKLTKSDGWLSVAGLFWLHEGVNRVGSDPLSDIVLPPSAPKNAGTLEFHNGQTRFRADGRPARDATLQPDVPGPADVVSIGSVSFTIVQRGKRYGVRVRDPESSARREFAGLHWFPSDEKYRIRARWIPYDPPKSIAITDILGDTENQKSPGRAEFELNGHPGHLEPVIEDNELFFMLKDQTSPKESYPSGRFLNAAMPKNGEVILDFNQTHNPPCAFTAFATCPLPPKQNWLPFRVEAGEKKYGKH